MLALPGRLLSYPVHLRFPSMDKQFEVQPTNTSMRSGQPAALSCRIQSAPPAQLSWLKDDQALPTNNRYHFLENDLLIMNVQTEDTGVYRCVAMNEHVNKVRASETARLLVVSDAVETTPSILSLSTEPNVTLEVGKKATLACPVQGWPRPKVYWEMTSSNGQIRRLDSAEEVLTLDSVTLDNNGSYTCRVDGHPDLYKTFNVSVWERVRMIFPPESKHVHRASTVRLNCTAEGTPEPTIRWYKDGRPLNITGRIKSLKSSKTQKVELVISGVTSSDAGTYQCFAENGHSSVSGWAQLNVTGGDTAEPVDVACAPVGAKAVRVTWTHRDPANNVAYTVHYSPKGGGKETTGSPQKKMEQDLTLSEPLTPYMFRVRAYRTDSASDLSDPVECQGQGVPVTIWESEGRIVVSWAQFAEETSAAQWILQVRKPTGDLVNVTILQPETTNYTLDVPTGEKWLVRLLGSKDPEWLPQNLTLVPWTSTEEAERDDTRNSNSVPTALEVARVWPRGALITWQYGGAVPSRQVFIVCVRTRGRLDETCQQSSNNTAEIEDLQPNTQYEVRVQALVGRSSGGAFSEPFLIVTPPEESQHFREVHYTPVNSTSVRVWWRAADDAQGPQHYTVRYSPELRLPMDEWDTINVTTNHALVPLGDSGRLFVMVMSHSPVEYSVVLSVDGRPQAEPTGLRNIKYEYTDDGLIIKWSDWSGDGGPVYSLRYSHNLTLPIENWTERNLTKSQLQNYNLGPLPEGAWTYVVVFPRGAARVSHMLNVPPQPARTHRAMLLGVSVGVAVCAACAAAGALCVWRQRRKRHRPAHRSRGTTTNDVLEDGSEMKHMSSAGGLANGGTKGAGEPLLNGHVHITDNPALSKTPNGKLKKPRRQNYDVFDFSRRDNEDTPHGAPSATLLDTSRPPEPYGKLPDDNMNSELGESPTAPTLQPNG